MMFTTWYHVTEKLPTESGWYLCYKAHSLGDDESEVKYFFFDSYKDQFYSSTQGHWANVAMWTDVDFDEWEPPVMTPALQNASNAVEKAIENFELIRNLTN